MRPIFKILVVLMGLGGNTYAQQPDEPRARAMADSICRAHIATCPGATYKIKFSKVYDQINYPKYNEPYLYHYQFDIQLREDMTADVNVSIHHDFSIKYVSGMEDSLSYEPCYALPRKELWTAAKKHGLNGPFKKVKFWYRYERDRLLVFFREFRSRVDLDHYVFNAMTGEFVGEQHMNVKF